MALGTKLVALVLMSARHCTIAAAYFSTAYSLLTPQQIGFTQQLPSRGSDMGFCRGALAREINRLRHLC